METVIDDAVPERGRTERLRDFPVVRRFQKEFGIDGTGTRRVHVRNDGGRSHAGVKESKEREADEIDASGLNFEPFGDLLDLGFKHSLGVNDAFRDAGAAAGEDNGGDVV